MSQHGGHAATGGAAVGYVANKDDYLRRLRRVEGQVRGLQRMEDKVREATAAVGPSTTTPSAKHGELTASNAPAAAPEPGPGPGHAVLAGRRGGSPDSRLLRFRVDGRPGRGTRAWRRP